MDNKKMVALNDEQLEKVDGGFAPLVPFIISGIIHVVVGGAIGAGVTLLGK